jgi:hypothetical protein
MRDDTYNIAIFVRLSHTIRFVKVQQFDGNVTDGNACLRISQSEVAI